MRVTVLGSGIIGVVTAYYLARDGHEVTVVDRQPDAALETSFANAGQVSFGLSAPWAAPGIPLKALKWMLSRHAPLVIRPRLDATVGRWMLELLRNCTPGRYAVNKARMVRLAEYSRQSLGELREATGIRYDERARGLLQLFRNERQIDGVQKDIAVLERFGVPHELLDAEGCVAAEPGLAAMREKVAGGLRFPLDETGDCFLFTRALAQRARALGVQFLHGTTVRHLETGSRGVEALDTDAGRLTADAYVVALGSYSPRLLRQLRMRIPVYPVKGYSITMPVVNDAAAPQSTLMDESHKVAITRLGDRIRAAGTAELAGYDLRLRESGRETVMHAVTDLFPGGDDASQSELWSGLRPMTPDGTPIVGPTRVPNLYLNTGHGTLGWTLSCGSGRLLADVISGRAPGIALEGLSVARYEEMAATRGGRTTTSAT